VPRQNEALMNIIKQEPEYMFIDLPPNFQDHNIFDASFAPSLLGKVIFILFLTGVQKLPSIDL
jgi:hypothetical protein